MADRRGASCDSGFVASTFACGERIAEQLVERRARRPLLLSDVPGGSNLTEDLALAEHRRIETGSDLEEMIDRSGVVLTVEVRGQFVDTEIAELAQEIADVAVGAVEQFGDHVHLGAVARGQHDRFANVVPLGEAAHGLGEMLRRDRDALQQCQWTTAVVDADDENGHWCSEPRPLPHAVARRAPHAAQLPWHGAVRGS